MAEPLHKTKGEIINLWASEEGSFLVALALNVSDKNFGQTFPLSQADTSGMVWHSKDTYHFRYITIPKDDESAVRVFDVHILGSFADVNAAAAPVNEAMGQGAVNFIEAQAELGLTAPNPDEMMEFQAVLKDHMRSFYEGTTEGGIIDETTKFYIKDDTE